MMFLFREREKIRKGKERREKEEEKKKSSIVNGDEDRQHPQNILSVQQKLHRRGRGGKEQTRICFPCQPPGASNLPHSSNASSAHQ